MDEIELVRGRSYRMTYKKRVVDFLHAQQGFYEAHNLKEKEESGHGWILFQDLKSHMRMHADYPVGNEGIEVVEIENENEEK